MSASIGPGKVKYLCKKKKKSYARIINDYGECSEPNDFLKWQHFRYPLPEVDFKYRK